MEPKWSQKGIQKAMIFWRGFRTPLETSTELRRNFEGAAGVTLSPADPPGRRHIIKDYCTIISKDGWLAGSNTPRAVGPANFPPHLFSILFLLYFVILLSVFMNFCSIYTYTIHTYVHMHAAQMHMHTRTNLLSHACVLLLVPYL